MIIIFGLRRLRKGMGPILLRCTNCGASPLALLRVSTWFALFFIPLVPISFKHYTVCPNCKRLDGVSKATVESARARQVEHSADVRPAAAPLPATLEAAVDEWAADGGVPAVAPTGPSAPGALAGELPPAGWYADPTNAAAQRYWDGAHWTERTGPLTTS